MVEITTSLGRSGLQDWLIQRVTAVFLMGYTLFLLGFLFGHNELHYREWHSLFAYPIVRYATLLVLLSLLAHAWIGLWTVTTDYLKAASVRLLVQVLIIAALLVCLFWGIDILFNFK